MCPEIKSCFPAQISWTASWEYSFISGAILSRCSTPFTWTPTIESFYASCGLRTTNLEIRYQSIAWTCTSLVTAPVQLLTAKRSWERMPWSSFIAISTSLAATQAILRTANLRLHKVVLNSVEVMEAFPLEDRGNGVRDLDLRCESLPAQRSLGVFWDLILGTTTSPFK